MKKQNKGITLVALVITIIILLILAGISISSLTGSGLFQKAGDAKIKSERAEIIEKARIDILEKQTENKRNLSEDELKGILKFYGDLSATNTSIFDEILTTKKGKYEIKVSDIWQGDLYIPIKEKKRINFSIFNTTFSAWERRYMGRLLKL